MAILVLLLSIGIAGEVKVGNISSKKGNVWMMFLLVGAAGILIIGHLISEILK